MEWGERYPVTVNDPESTDRVNAAFAAEFGEDNVLRPVALSGSEDVGNLATAAGAPLVYWMLGGADPETVLTAMAAGTADTTSRRTTRRSSRRFPSRPSTPGCGRSSSPRGSGWPDRRSSGSGSEERPARGASLLLRSPLRGGVPPGLSSVLSARLSAGRAAVIAEEGDRVPNLLHWQ